MQRVIRSVVNLIKQTEGTDPPSVPKQQSSPLHNFPHCEQHYPANSNETAQSAFTLGHNTPGWVKYTTVHRCIT